MVPVAGIHDRPKYPPEKNPHEILHGSVNFK